MIISAGGDAVISIFLVPVVYTVIFLITVTGFGISSTFWPSASDILLQ
jgi:hypothetical protein